MQDADRAGGSHIVLDLSEATLLDSAGLGVISRLAGAGVRIHIHGATGVVRRALDIGRLAQTPNITLA